MTRFVKFVWHKRVLLSTGSTQEDLSYITERLLMGHKESKQTKKEGF